MRFFFVLTLVGGVLASATLLIGLLTANGAPQQAAVAAIACAFVVIPYAMARALEKLR